MTLTLTDTQADSLKAFLSLIEQRAREPTNHKQTNINIHSIAVASKRGYTSVKVALENLNKKIGV